MDKERYIGLVKWFHDQQRNANFGFIQHAKLGDLFFHERLIEQGQDMNSFRENEIVVFSIQESKRHEGKLEAVEVKHLSTETDVNFLFAHFLSIQTEKGNYSDFNLIQKGVHTKITSLIGYSEDKNISEQMFSRFEDYLNSLLQSKIVENESQLIGALKICKSLFADKYNHVSALIEKSVSVKIAHQLWLEGYLEKCQIDLIVELIISSTPPDRNWILSKCNENDKLIILPKLVSNLEQIDNTLFSDEKYLEGFLQVCQWYFSKNYKQLADFFEKRISSELACKFWLNDWIFTCPIEYIATSIISASFQTTEEIFNRCSEQDKTNILFKILENITEIDDRTDIKKKYDTIKQLLYICRRFAPEHYDKILESVLQLSPDSFKLNLWLDDYLEVLDFHNFKLYTATLIPQEQKKFIKKVLNYIHEEKSNISVEDLASLNVIDYGTSKESKLKDGTHLDYSTSIILNVLTELKNQSRYVEKESIRKMYDIILTQIKEPNDILQITGYFDECEGRYNSTSNRNKYDKPMPICDGRKAIDKNTKQPAKDKNNLEFWWCANKKCYNPSRVLHQSYEWEQYTLIDFLTILKVPFQEHELEIYLSLINKANRFLSHLKCRECSYILTPNGQANYAFWGVNEFHCNNNNCQKYGENIYITHCLNGACGDIIDSRDCVRCKHEDTGQTGLYICNYCHACCSTEQLERRHWVFENIIHQEYRGLLQGHKDKGMLCCNKCGSAMEDVEFDKENYRKVLDWFISKRCDNSQIEKSGKRPNDNRWWFMMKRNNLEQPQFREKLTNLLLLGFNIENFEHDREVYFISEKTDKDRKEVFKCSNQACKNVLVLSRNQARANAITNFHDVRFQTPNTDLETDNELL